MLKRTLLGAALAALATSVSVAETVNIDATQVQFSGVELYSDIQYSTSALGLMRNELYLDLIRPTSAEPAPVIVFITGSGWRAVERERLIPQLVRFAEAGFAVATIDYRGIGEAKFPEPQKDVKAAVRYLRANADLYNLDADNIAVFGPSAGGHLALMAGLTGNDPDYVDERLSDVSSEVQAIATFYPAAYFGETGEPGYDLASMHMGLSVHDKANAEAVREAFPETHIGEDSPPVIVIQGTEDQVVPLSSSERLYAALEAGGVDATLVVVDGVGHDFEQMTSVPEVTDALVDFFTRTLKD
ncbi:Acetyl esterase/lipase [Devosia lucknowensis]|uniref:Acetyl esterase/lipase n=1 Tax=Devosia lucknowensis TaxID=1096929 RepID=A0A1Y6F6J7_9HYPH|nr:alpha/beta hydrolase [Devosia lucknowensis]SMQ70179.1 Acetyl esterase/lipase [Devosia lucknowensis]